MVTLIVRATIWLALTAFVLAECGRALARRRGAPVSWALPVFAIGALLCAAHFVATLYWRHGWSHADAIAFTAQQTQAVYGLAWGGGLWVNYIFLGAWIAEAVWWARHPAHVLAPVSTRRWALRAFYALIIVNAAVVFPSGPARVLGVVLVSVLVAVWMLEPKPAARNRAATYGKLQSRARSSAG